jgi:hypothetical protein
MMSHPRTSTRPEARGIIDAYWTCSVSVYHQRTTAEADLLRSAHEPMQLVRLASRNSVSQPSFLNLGKVPGGCR